MDTSDIVIFFILAGFFGMFGLIAWSIDGERKRREVPEPKQSENPTTLRLYIESLQADNSALTSENKRLKAENTFLKSPRSEAFKPPAAPEPKPAYRAPQVQTIVQPERIVCDPRPHSDNYTRVAEFFMRQTPAVAESFKKNPAATLIAFGLLVVVAHEIQRRRS